MPDWKVSADLVAANAMLDNLERALTAGPVEKVAAKAAATMAQESAEAFAGAHDPRTGATWAAPADATRNRRGWRGLLGGPGGSIAAAVRTGYALTPGGARAFINVENEQVKVAMIQFFGGRGKSKSAKSRARKSKALGRMTGWSLPARRAFGISPRGVSEIMDYARAQIEGAAR